MDNIYHTYTAYIEVILDDGKSKFCMWQIFYSDGTNDTLKKVVKK